MDDSEYYSMMNRSNSALILNDLVKKAQQKKKQEKLKKSHTQAETTQINLTEGRQGREDTEMLHEKKGDFVNEE